MTFFLGLDLYHEWEEYLTPAFVRKTRSGMKSLDVTQGAAPIVVLSLLLSPLLSTILTGPS